MAERPLKSHRWPDPQVAAEIMKVDILKSYIGSIINNCLVKTDFCLINLCKHSYQPMGVFSASGNKSAKWGGDQMRETALDCL